ncbi:hypothetical protein BH09BAC3_BH09BAC3_00100 [soil metagenome]
MKKNIIIAVLIALTLFSSIYAFIQQTVAVAAQKEAEMNLILALEAEKRASANAAEAAQQARVAMEQQKLAVEERARAQSALENCMKRK